MNLAMIRPGAWEIAIVAIVLLLLFGTRLPKIARSLGQSFRELRNGFAEAEEVEREIRKP